MGYVSQAIPRGRNFWTTNVTTRAEWFRLRCRVNQKFAVGCWLRGVNDHQGSKAPAKKKMPFLRGLSKLTEPSRVQQLRTLWLFNLRSSTWNLQNPDNDFERPFQFAPGFLDEVCSNPEWFWAWKLMAKQGKATTKRCTGKGTCWTNSLMASDVFRNWDFNDNFTGWYHLDIEYTQVVFKRRTNWTLLRI